MASSPCGLMGPCGPAGLKGPPGPPRGLCCCGWGGSWCGQPRGGPKGPGGSPSRDCPGCPPGLKLPGGCMRPGPCAMRCCGPPIWCWCRGGRNPGPGPGWGGPLKFIVPRGRISCAWGGIQEPCAGPMPSGGAPGPPLPPALGPPGPLGSGPLESWNCGGRAPPEGPGGSAPALNGGPPCGFCPRCTGPRGG